MFAFLRISFNLFSTFIEQTNNQMKTISKQ